MKNVMKPLVVGSAVVMTLVSANATLAYAKEKGVSGSWTLSAEGYVLPLVLTQRGTSAD